MKHICLLFVVIAIGTASKAQRVNFSVEGNHTFYQPVNSGYTTAQSSGISGLGIAVGYRVFSIEEINVDARFGYKRFGGSISHTSITSDAFFEVNAHSSLDALFSDIFIIFNRPQHKFHGGFGFSVTRIFEENITGKYRSHEFGHVSSSEFQPNQYLVNQKQNIHVKAFLGYDVIESTKYIGRIFSTFSVGLQEEMSIFRAKQVTLGLSVMVKGNQ